MSGLPTKTDQTSPDQRSRAAIELRVRILEYQLDYVRAEMLHLLHERDRWIYSASWFVYRPLRALEEKLVDAFAAMRHWAGPATAPQRVNVVPSDNRAPQGARENALPKRLLIDVTGTIRRDMATGIERVVKNVIKALYEGNDLNIPAIAVRCEGGRLFACGEFVAKLVNKPQPSADEEISFEPGDRFLMLSDSWNAFDEFIPLFERIRACGGEIVTCVFDLIPEIYPYACHEVTPPLYRVWLRKALRESDAFIAISRTVAEELATYVDERGLAHRGDLKIGWFHCGSDIPAPTHAKLRDKTRAAIAGPTPIFLCVGTIEPRKGHRVALEAFEELWRKGVDARLVIVGRNGWYAEALIADIKQNREFGRRLFWFDDVDDGELSVLYDSASAVLCPSYAEGFGLPIVEAARRGRPAICSDIPVFREVGGNGAAYFRAADPHALASCIESWLKGEVAADPTKVNCVTWAEAARRIVDVIMRDQWMAPHGSRQELGAWPVAASSDRIRLMERQLEWLYAEMLCFVHEREKMIYSAAGGIFLPLREFEAKLVRAASGLARPFSHTKTERPGAATQPLEVGAPPVPRSFQGARRVLFDVTGVVKQDVGTGVQRVVKNLLRAMRELNGPVLPTLAVYCEKGRLTALPEFGASLEKYEPAATEAVVIESGDVFLMVSDTWNALDEYGSVFEHLHECGGEIVSGLHDLIPELYPHACHEVTVSRYSAWFRRMLLYSDGVLAVSRTVAEEFETYVKERDLPHRPGLKIGWFHNGSDMPTAPVAKAREKVKRAVEGSAPAFLCVGTLEPRKGHRVAMEAFDALWSDGVDARLIFVGRRGWYDKALIQDILGHPEFGRRLQWFDDIGDGELSFLYERAHAVICPSFAEGFGLPIVEAARRGRPVICSDIAVFREVGGEGAAYFRANDAEALAACVRQFLKGEIPLDPRKASQTTWEEAARRIVSIISNDEWSARLP
jgi:glycosyltransferase involved in cell wall biosynthesis